MSTAVAKVMIVVPNYWGKGDTITEAWEQVKKESARTLRELKSGPHQIYVVWDDGEHKSRLDEFGLNIQYPGDHRPILIEANE